ncbi:rhomboid family intramembrane serine protease [Dysgonomonas sp. 511]|uniref:rhomboid family intramembrane serine protease n=1 Tax=Dysgonomonas sp. 511 TaxID=2302930 RepID=UPI0013D6C77E|nr:rhomboid family intramembrane serine protease [Dysgonomonas sp. 511]NDV79609.1 rhomboid family intramembrane serine protease [Dysgonomonas sp. 511]
MNFDIAGILPIIIIALTTITSIKGFGDMAFFDRYKFNVGAILGHSKQWDRLLTSATLHGDYMHLIFNMYTFYIFSPYIIKILGIWQFLAIYFLAIIAGGLLSLFVHRKEYYYSAIGASGGVVGVLFAAIALYPQMTLGVMFVLPMPGWLFGIIYLAYSVYAMHKGHGNIGHDAHLGGAAVGLIMAIVFMPSILHRHIEYIGLMALPLIVLAYLVLKRK